MMQNLLAERFKLAVHHEQKEMAMYDLVIAKGGPKLKETVPDEPLPHSEGRQASSPGEKPKMDTEGYPSCRKAVR